MNEIQNHYMEYVANNFLIFGVIVTVGTVVAMSVVDYSIKHQNRLGKFLIKFFELN